MSALLANSVFHALNDALQAPEPTFDELMEELQDQLSEAEYRLAIAERRSDPYRWQTERDRWLRRISAVNAQMNALKGGV